MTKIYLIKKTNDDKKVSSWDEYIMTEDTEDKESPNIKSTWWYPTKLYIYAYGDFFDFDPTEKRAYMGSQTELYLSANQAQKISSYIKGSREIPLGIESWNSEYYEQKEMDSYLQEIPLTVIGAQNLYNLSKIEEHFIPEKAINDDLFFFELKGIKKLKVGLAITEKCKNYFELIGLDNLLYEEILVKE